MGAAPTRPSAVVQCKKVRFMADKSATSSRFVTASRRSAVRRAGRALRGGSSPRDQHATISTGSSSAARAVRREHQEDLSAGRPRNVQVIRVDLELGRSISVWWRFGAVRRQRDGHQRRDHEDFTQRSRAQRPGRASAPRRRERSGASGVPAACFQRGGVLGRSVLSSVLSAPSRVAA